jgi:protein phosphatase
MDASGPTHLDRLQVRAENLYLPASRLTFLQSARPQHVPNHYTVVGLTDVGQTRSRNEDSLAILPDLGVAVVADGMGGHPGGDVASRVAAEAATRSLAESLPGTEYPKEVMRSSVISAHEAIRLAVEKDPELEGMGTTITAFALDSTRDSFVLGHVGDSRAYRFRGGELTQLTKDDTWVQERIDAEQLTPDQARRHPFAHLLTQCLGLSDIPVPHIIGGSVQPGDIYLLCTDGLVGMLQDPELTEILARGTSANGAPADPSHRLQVAQELVDAANGAGGYDNITAVLVTIEAGPDT